jgi:hypothetical protein
MQGLNSIKNINAEFYLNKLNIMDLQTRKISFVQEFLKIQSEEVVVRLEKALLKEKKNNLGKIAQPITLEELNKRIDQSMLDSENGKLTDNNELATEMQNWK